MATSVSLPPKKRVQLHPGQTRLDNAPIPQEYIEKLKTLGYVTLEQVVSVASMVTVRPRLNAYLGTDVGKVLANIPKQDVAPQLSIKASTARYSFGARLKKPVKAVLPHADLSAARHVPPAMSAPPPPVSPLGSTPEVNLKDRMPPIRDQANRGTCVAHAGVAAFEYYLIEQGLAAPATVDLSEQFLYWNCKAHDGHPHDEGTLLEVAMPLLFSDGCCLESVWPYKPNPVPGNEGQGPPPTAAQPDAATRKTPGTKQLTAKSVQEIKDELASNRCVAVSLAYFDDSWSTKDIRNTGSVTMPFPDEVTDEGHAVCLIGYEDLADEPDLGGGRFILRNSWDSYWGVRCDFGTGYGTLPYAYVTTYCEEAYSIA